MIAEEIRGGSRKVLISREFCKKVTDTKAIEDWTYKKDMNYEVII